jgi:UDP-N-acetylmuramate--alanine ligase
MASRKAITIAGTHGKTTTTALISIMLEKAGIDPTIMIGGQIDELKGNAKLGKSEWFVAEADESDGSFLKYNPYLAVITNVEAEHLDFYGTEDKVIEAFKEFVTRVKPDGKIILCLDCPRTMKIRESATVPAVTFGFNENADLWPGEISIIGEQTNFNVYTKKGPLGRIRLQIPGHHNIMNALAAIAVGREMGISFHDMQASMASFSGVGRRFQRLGVYHGASIIDDYAHAPAEVAATIAAARSFEPSRVIAVFQPHLFSRTRLFAEEFAKALCGADQVFLAPIYPAREEPIPGVTSEIVADSIKRHDGPQVFYSDEIENLKKSIKQTIRPGDYVLFMGAGDIWKVGSRLVTEED